MIFREEIPKLGPSLQPACKQSYGIPGSGRLKAPKDWTYLRLCSLLLSLIQYVLVTWYMCPANIDVFEKLAGKWRMVLVEAPRGLWELLTQQEEGELGNKESLLEKVPGTEVW